MNNFEIALVFSVAFLLVSIYAESVLELSTDYNNGIYVNGTVKTSTAKVWKDLETIWITRFSIPRKTGENTYKRAFSDELELVPTGRWTGLPRDLPTQIICSSVSTCPQWRIEEDISSVKWEPRPGCYTEHGNHGPRRKATGYLSLKREAFKKTDIHVTVICKVPGYMKSLDLHISPYLPVPCNSTDYCLSEYSYHSECKKMGSRGICKCYQKYVFDGFKCSEPKQDTNSSSGIYKAMMVAVACFSVVVIALFLLFICNRTLRSRRRFEQPVDDMLGRRSSDVYSVSDRLARLRLVDKPPTYDDVLRNDREHRGVPPPAYDLSHEEREEPEPLRPSRSTRRTPDEEHSQISRLALRLNRLRTSQANEDGEVTVHRTRSSPIRNTTSSATSCSVNQSRASADNQQIAMTRSSGADPVQANAVVHNQMADNFANRQVEIVTYQSVPQSGTNSNIVNEQNRILEETPTTYDNLGFDSDV